MSLRRALIPAVSTLSVLTTGAGCSADPAVGTWDAVEVRRGPYTYALPYTYSSVEGATTWVSTLGYRLVLDRDGTGSWTFEERTTADGVVVEELSAEQRQGVTAVQLDRARWELDGFFDDLPISVTCTAVADRLSCEGDSAVGESIGLDWERVVED